MTQAYAYEVWLDEVHVDTVYFTGYTVEEVRKSLIEHDSYPDDIEVFRRVPLRDVTPR